MFFMLISEPSWARPISLSATKKPSLLRNPRPVGSDRSQMRLSTTSLSPDFLRNFAASSAPISLLSFGSSCESADHAQLVELLVSKDKEMKSTLQLAADQAGIERKLDGLRDQFRDQDEEIKQLKEAEYILATSIFQARQKLTSFAKATKRPVSSDELIKFAHRKNASNAICAPLTWQQGDQRRPYPTDRDAAGLPLQFRPDLQRDQNPATQNSLGEINRTHAVRFVDTI
ncbi:mediator complex [Culex quinquefasciatus]|uniref:Mediator of RNA polymerase II transcription subunit 4 n=1 Tax=Culex quinquefasciatus TaxID=7176 RepID=B0XGK5_CULQU|nr:mediator complex [Culex quinquefasciatus]|eukprot:XP_001868777.1 mediator complex [Culex quinquefasciatus]